MKKLFKSFTFWFAVASVLIILLNVIGQDSKNIVLTLSNYPLYMILQKAGFKLYDPNAIDHTFFISQMFSWFVWHFVSYLCYGFIIDLIRRMFFGKKKDLKKMNIQDLR